MHQEDMGKCPCCGQDGCAPEDHYFDPYGGAMGLRFRCPDCGAVYEAKYEFSCEVAVVELPGTFEGLLKAAYNMGYENEDAGEERFRELVARAEEIAMEG